MRHLASLVLAAAAPVVLSAQVPSAPVTLSEAMALALANHPEPQAARAGATAASEDVGVAQTAYWPRLDMLWQTNHATRNNVFGLLLPQFVVPPVSGPVLEDDTLGGVWSSAGGLLLSWEPLDFGRRSAGVALALPAWGPSWRWPRPSACSQTPKRRLRWPRSQSGGRDSPKPSSPVTSRPWYA
jgi:outer membrane protein TolC